MCDFNRILDVHAPWKIMHFSVDPSDQAPREFPATYKLSDQHKNMPGRHKMLRILLGQNAAETSRQQNLKEM